MDTPWFYYTVPSEVYTYVKGEFFLYTKSENRIMTN